MTGRLDEKTMVWDATNGRLLLTLSGQRGRVAVTAFSGDGRRNLTSGFDLTTRMWDTKTGDELLSITGIVAFALSPDDRRIVTAGPPSVQLIELPCPRLVASWATDESVAVEAPGADQSNQ